jgi:hypothetical protein
MGHLKTKSQKRRVKFNTTRRIVHEYENPELPPIPKPDIFDRMLAKTNVATIYKPPAGPYPKSLRSKVAKAAKQRLTLRYNVERLGKKLRGIPESDIRSLMPRSRYRSRRIPNSAIPPSGTGDE